MRFIVAAIFTIFIQIQAFSGFDPVARGAKATSMSYCSVSLMDNFSLFNNPSATSWDAKYHASVFFENKFLLKELSTKGIGLSIPITTNDAIGVVFSQFGYSAYNESKIGIYYAKSFANRVSASLQFDYLNTAIDIESGKKNNFAIECALQGKINKNLNLGVHIFNPTRSKLTDYNDIDEYIPVVIKFGLSYKFSDNFLLTAETEKSITSQTILRFGGDYRINKMFFVRGGISTGIINYSFGFGIQWNDFIFDFGTSAHQTLGYTPAFSLNYNFSNLFNKNRKSEK